LGIPSLGEEGEVMFVNVGPYSGDYGVPGEVWVNASEIVSIYSDPHGLNGTHIVMSRGRNFYLHKDMTEVVRLLRNVLVPDADLDETPAMGVRIKAERAGSL
jgi:hypothetical protein